MDMNEYKAEDKKCFWENNWQWIVSMVMFVVFAGFMIYNTWPQKHPETQELLNGLKQQMPTIIGENTVEQETTIKSVPVYDAWGRVVTANKTSSTTKKSKLPESYVISKENMDKALTAVAYAARTEAQNEYKNNFSILLTILTILGIAWPIIVAYINYKMNKDKLKEIDNLRKDTSRGFSILQKQTCNKLGGIMTQIAGTIQEDEAKSYCTLLAFIFLYQGESQNFSEALDCLKEDFDKLDFWSNADKKVQVVRTIEAFLTANVIDPQTRIIIEELQEKAIKTEVKEQDK